MFNNGAGTGTIDAKRDRFSDPIEKTKSDALNLKSDLNTLKDDAKDSLGKLNDMAQSAGRQVREAVSVASRNVTDATTVTADHIRHNPIQSSVVALAVGFLLGGLLLRR